MADNYAQNRATRAAYVKSELGLTEKPVNEWTYEERNAYMQASATYTIDRPAQFSAQDLATARTALHYVEQATPLETLSVADKVAIFGEEFGNQVVKAGESVAAVGQGVLTTLKMGSWLIPVAALAVAGVLLWKFSKK